MRTARRAHAPKHLAAIVLVLQWVGMAGAHAAAPPASPGAAGPGEAAPARTAPVLTVCADPNNMPFSNRAGEGFENVLVRLIARDLGLAVHYVWWAQRRAFLRHTLSENRCDLWPGVASGAGQVATTRPYYRSSYVFLSRPERHLSGLSLDDPRLRTLSIGVQLIGADAMNAPPAHALAQRGLTDNVHGYMVYGDYGRPNPAADIVRAVAGGQIDVAIVWGPLAGYFAAQSVPPLRIEPVRPSAQDRALPMSFAISVGVRTQNRRLLESVQAVLDREQQPIRQLLERYHVPLQ